MLKRLILALIFAGLLSPAYSAGTIPLSLSQRFDKTSQKPLAGGKLYFYQAGTVGTPQNAYQDSALTIPWGNPLTLDAGGNVPQLFFADGQIKIRLDNSKGTNQLTVDNIQVIGASSGGGGGGAVDATTILATGDIKSRYGSGALSGFVRLNGRTIGSATSGGTERANSDCQALFQYLWDTDPNLTVSGGRGGSSAADFAANKTIALPDFRSRALAGLADMGNTDNGLFAGVTFSSGTSTTLGSLVGFSRRTLLTTNLPPYTPAGSISTATGTVALQTPVPYTNTFTAGGQSIAFAGNSTPLSINAQTFTGTAAPGQNSTPFDTVSPYALITLYQKL